MNMNPPKGTRAFDQKLSWLVAVILAITIAVVCVSLWLAIEAQGATTRPDPCWTKAQARERFPAKVLYWHTEHRCWDATPLRQYRRPAAARKQWYVVIPLDRNDPLRK